MLHCLPATAAWSAHYSMLRQEALLLLSTVRRATSRSPSMSIIQHSCKLPCKMIEATQSCFAAPYPLSLLPPSTDSAASFVQVINSIQNAPAAERPGGFLAYLSMAYAAAFMCNNTLEAAQVGFVIYSIVSAPMLLAPP